MCDVCDRENKNWKLATGDKELRWAKLFRVYIGQVASIKLCHIHAIELFCIGEKRFLGNHLPLAAALSLEKKSFVSNYA